MSLQLISVVPDDSRTTAVVTLSSDLVGADAITELTGMSAKREAIKFAQDSLVDPRVNGDIRHYPVDAKGNVIQEFTAKTKVAEYRAEIPVVKRLV